MSKTVLRRICAALAITMGLAMSLASCSGKSEPTEEETAVTDNKMKQVQGEQYGDPGPAPPGG